MTVFNIGESCDLAPVIILSMQRSKLYEWQH
jgi:hypothetical protein